MIKKRTPQEIEAESMRIIDQEAGPHAFADNEWPVVRRIIHATADFEFMRTLRFSGSAVAAATAALRTGAPIYADTQMLAAAISKSAAAQWGCRIECHIGDDGIRDESRRTGETRSVLAVRKAARAFQQGGIIAIGNAPTALHEAIALCEQDQMAPDLIVGLPVGFVEARESKERLAKTQLAYITNLDRKGGTPAAAAALNALIRIAAAA
ncbi:precorrin-8X methylmutase [Thermodesulfobacteriota bacterium]